MSASSKKKLRKEQNAATLTEKQRQEQAEAKKSDPIMTLRFKITSTSYYYTYDFYRFDDRRVMVSLYQSDASGAAVTGNEVSDFYLTTFAFKKIAYNFKNLLNGVMIDADVGYSEQK